MDTDNCLRLKTILDAIPDIIVEVDANKIYTWSNKHGLEFFGDDVIGHEAKFYFLGDQDTYKIVQPVFEGNDDIVYVESWQRRKDGQKRLLAWSCHTLKDENGNVRGAISTALDITEKRLLEEELKKNENISQNIIQSSPLGMHIYKLDEENNLIFEGANEAANKILGIDNSQFIGKKIEEAFPGLRNTEVPTRYIEVAKNGVPWHADQIIYDDGKIKGIFKISTFRTYPGHMITSFQDITQEKQSEELLKSKIDELEKMNKLMIGRELRMSELKDKVLELEAKLQNK
jgi:PAS domain S-box-containing protein